MTLPIPRIPTSLVTTAWQAYLATLQPALERGWSVTERQKRERLFLEGFYAGWEACAHHTRKEA